MSDVIASTPPPSAEKSARRPACPEVTAQVGLLLAASPVALFLQVTRKAGEWFGRRVVRPARARRRHRATIRELAQLSEHQLRDIGLTRADIYAASIGSFERR